MPQPVLHVVAGPNGAGKTTFCAAVLGPTINLAFVNADLIAAQRWPEEAAARSYEAARIAADERARRMGAGESFATETVFSHESKLELLSTAAQAGYLTTLHIILIPEELAVARVVNRVSVGGHHVPEDKIRSRYPRLWRHLREAISLVDEARVYDNSTIATPFRLVATYANGALVTVDPRWPPWTPDDLRDAGR